MRVGPRDLALNSLPIVRRKPRQLPREEGDMTRSALLTMIACFFIQTGLAKAQPINGGDGTYGDPQNPTYVACFYDYADDNFSGCGRGFQATFGCGVTTDEAGKRLCDIFTLKGGEVPVAFDIDDIRRAGGGGCGFTTMVFTCHIPMLQFSFIRQVNRTLYCGVLPKGAGAEVCLGEFSPPTTTYRAWMYFYAQQQPCGHDSVTVACYNPPQ
jgi:hypothetical protein